MDIVLAGGTKTTHWTSDNIASGYENLAYIFDGYWYSLHEAYNCIHDVVFINGTADNLRFLINHGGKSSKWGKLVVLGETGLFQPNYLPTTEMLINC